MRVSVPNWGLPGWNHKVTEVSLTKTVSFIFTVVIGAGWFAEHPTICFVDWRVDI